MSTEAQRFINLLSPYIHSYGYWVAFFGMMLENAGIPVPGETALIIISFFAGQGFLKIWLALLITIIGDIIGDTIGYAIGRFGGRPLVERYGRYVRIDKAKLDAAEALFRERGGRTVFASQFSSVTRTTGSLIAGLSHMPFKRFVAYDSAAATVLVVLVGSVTFYFGKNLDATLRFFHLFRLVALAVVATIVTAYLYRYYQQRKHLYRRLGLRIIAVTTAVSIVIGLSYYAVSGALIVLPRTGKSAGLTHSSIKGIEFDVEQGFISDIESNNLLITALGEPSLEFHKSEQAVLIKMTVRNIKARETVAQSNSIMQQPLVLDDLTLHFGIKLNPTRKTEIALRPKMTTEQFDFAVTGDTRDAGPIFNQLLDSVNARNPAFLIHAGDFVKDGEKRKYRAFLDQIGVLRAPLFTAIGTHELLDRGERLYSELFGPKNYSFSYQNSKFLIFNTSKASKEIDLAWLSKELKSSGTARNIFIITYAVPFDSERFTDLVANSKVKAVYSIRAIGTYYPLFKGVRYDLLEHQAEAPYSYRIVIVNGSEVSEEVVKIIPRGLTVIDKVILAFEELKREITGYFSK